MALAINWIVGTSGNWGVYGSAPTMEYWAKETSLCAATVVPMRHRLWHQARRPRLGPISVSMAKALGARVAIYGKNLAGGFAGYFDGKCREGGFTYSSDRHLKANFVQSTRAQSLTAWASIPIRPGTTERAREWRHMGWTAQDFRAAFSLGEDDKTIASVDMNGCDGGGASGLVSDRKERTDRSKSRAGRSKSYRRGSRQSSATTRQSVQATAAAGKMKDRGGITFTQLRLRTQS